MSGGVVILGAGGHAKVVIDVFRSAGIHVERCLVPGGSGEVSGVPIVDEGEGLHELRTRRASRAFIAIGSNDVRHRLGRELRAAGVEFANAISPTAYVASDVRLGSGILIAPQAVVNAASEIGDDVIVNTASSVDHDGRIGAAAHIAPGTRLAGNVLVGERGFLGVGTSVIPGISVGAGAMVGAGSVVIRDIPDGARAWGNPARVTDQ
jgi:UDP-perosamine 4-acetyltransferase